ncbi:MAG TPA: hypothetical protein VML75_26460 [Kofleriaceae bacterium]|nr:hypothetical protein [Kofleriaceae bacterium]
MERIAARWRECGDDPSRARVIGDLFRSATTALRARHGVPGDTPIDGASRALYALGMGLGDGREYIFERALRAALAEPRTSWTIDVLGSLALQYPPAFEPALACARDRPRGSSPRDIVLAKTSIEALARLVAAAPEATRVALFEETMAAARKSDYRPHDVPYLIATGAQRVGATAPDVVLARVATVDPSYRALAYALAAAHLPAAHRRRAIDEALAVPSLGDARPFVAMADCLEPDHYPRALELADALYSSPSCGATAVRALVPGWAALGHVEDALARAGAIAHEPERQLALALIAPHVSDLHARDQLVRRATADLSGSALALAAPALVPLGYAAVLRDAGCGGSADALAGLAAAAVGPERARFLAELSAKRDPLSMQPSLARELAPEIVFPAWLRAFQHACKAPALDEFFEDECGWGLTNWMSLVPLFGGADAARQVADAVVP